MMENWIWLVMGCMVTLTALGVGHYIPKLNEPGRLWRYVYGVGFIYAGFCVWRLPQQDWIAPLGLAAIIGSGGGLVLFLYWWDNLIHEARKGKKAEAVDDDLAE